MLRSESLSQRARGEVSVNSSSVCVCMCFFPVFDVLSNVVLDVFKCVLVCFLKMCPSSYCLMQLCLIFFFTKLPTTQGD